MTPFGAVRLRLKQGDFLVNAQRIKHYFEKDENIDMIDTVRLYDRRLECP